ncbi:MAG: hypothetical protein ACRCZI_00545 [Cetobacterium sp.]
MLKVGLAQVLKNMQTSQFTEPVMVAEYVVDLIRGSAYALDSDALTNEIDVGLQEVIASARLIRESLYSRRSS